MKNNWVFTPPTNNGNPAAYVRRGGDMHVIQRGPSSWGAYHISYGYVVEGVFVDAPSAMSWCEGRLA